MTDYVHGYGTREQQRLVEQAEHWRHRLIAHGTTLKPGTRLLEVGCGVGAVLAVLGQEFRGIRLHGVDIQPKQLDLPGGTSSEPGSRPPCSRLTHTRSRSRTSRSIMSG